MVEDANKISGAMGMAAKESDGLENVVGNLNQSWTDLKAAVGEPIMDKAIDQMIGLTHWIGRINAEKISDGLVSAGTYLSETFGPILSEILEDIQGVWSALNSETGAEGIQIVLQEVQDSMNWIADNWEDLKDGIFALTAAFVAYKGALAGIMILQTINKLMVLYHSGLLITTAQQWLLNSAMLANPLGLVAIAIGALVGAGILLYQNWDIVREKTGALWDKLGAFQGVATLVLGPIGFIIRAAVTMAEQWDSTKGIWENIWTGIATAAENSVNQVVDSINWLINKINQIPNVDIPIISRVNFIGADMKQSSKTVDTMSYAEAVHGSHATGLARVPFDSYTAELHKDEAVLTASQANTLRGMGALKSTAGKPVLDTSALGDSQRTGTGRKVDRGLLRKRATVSVGSININGANKTTKEMVREMVDELKYVISAGALEGDMQ